MLQTINFSLNINPKNGTVTIPKKLREILKLDKNNTSLNIKVSPESKKAEIEIPEYTLDDVLYNLPPLASNTNFTDQDYKKAVEEGFIKKHKKKLK